MTTINWATAFNWLNLRNNLGYSEDYCLDLMKEYLETLHEYKPEQIEEILSELKID